MIMTHVESKNDDVCVVLKVCVLNAFNFLSRHLDGELAILPFADGDAAAGFEMILTLDVVEKYAKDTIIGVVSRGEAKKASGAAKSALPVASDEGDAAANSEAWGDWRMEALDDEPGVLWVMVRSYVHAFHYPINQRHL